MSEQKNNFIVKAVEKTLRETFKNELKNTYSNRIAIVKNLDIYKKVKLSYSGKGLLAEDFIAIEESLYPKMPWENSVKIGFATEEEASTLYIFSVLILAHNAITIRTGLTPWVRESEVEHENSDFISEVKPVLDNILINFQMFFSQNIIEMEKYLAELINGKDRRIALKENNALINIYTPDEMKDYVFLKHEEIHNNVKKMKDFEITSGYERERKIMVYKNISAVLNEYLLYAKFLKEVTIAWNQHKYYYGCSAN